MSGNNPRKRELDNRELSMDAHYKGEEEEVFNEENTTNK